MKLDDVKWALGELAAAIVRGPHRNCDCHPRLNDRPRAQQEADSPAANAENPLPGSKS